MFLSRLAFRFALIGALKAFDGWRLQGVRRWAVLLAAVAAAALVHARADYGLFGVALILGLYLTRRSRAAQAAVILLWCFAEYYVRCTTQLCSVCLPCAGAIPGRRVRAAFY